MTNKLYICIGENFLDGTRIGYCGCSYTLQQWLEILFPGKNAVEYFAGANDKEIVTYILKFKGKRLEQLKI